MIKSKKSYSPSADLWRPFHKTHGKLYIGIPYDNTIYVVKNDTISPAYQIDAGGYSIPKEFYDNTREVWLQLMQKDGYAALFNFLESDNYLVLQMALRQSEFENMVWGIKNKRANKWFWSKKETWQYGVSHEYKVAEITADNRLMILMDPYELKELLPQMKNVLNPHVLNILHDDDNSVLVEIKLK